MDERKRKYENALEVSREFAAIDFSAAVSSNNKLSAFQWWAIRVGLGIWRELDTLTALYRERK